MTESEDTARTVGIAHVEQLEGGFDIDELEISDSWKLKFRIIEKAGGVKLPNFKELTFGERMRIGFNILGFLFGPIYYIVKGMWKRATTLLAISLVTIVALSIVLEFVGLDHVSNALRYGAAALFAARANIDYYKKVVLGNNDWW